MLAVNSAWPVVYRILHEDKFGKKLESGAAFGMHEVGWLVLLPALLALANLLGGCAIFAWCMSLTGDLALPATRRQLRMTVTEARLG